MLAANYSEIFCNFQDAAMAEETAESGQGGYTSVEVTNRLFLRIIM